jgi:hypothetical protein
VRLQRIRECQHPLEVAQSDTWSAIGCEQCPQGHDVAAPVAAQAWMRWSATTTSS